MAETLAKKFERIIAEAFRWVDGTSVDRLHDQTNGFEGSSNICDYIVYRFPFEYYIECKTVHGNTLSIHSIPKPDKHGNLKGYHGNISDMQWNGLSNKSKVYGVQAGVICWWVDHDVTMYLSIEELEECYQHGCKSIRYDHESRLVWGAFDIVGTKKRVFFDYDMNKFFDKMAHKVSY